MRAQCRCMNYTRTGLSLRRKKREFPSLLTLIWYSISFLFVLLRVRGIGFSPRIQIPWKHRQSFTFKLHKICLIILKNTLPYTCLDSETELALVWVFGRLKKIQSMSVYGKKKKRLKDSHALDLWGIKLLQLVCFNIQQNVAHWRTKWKHMGMEGEKKKTPCWKFEETRNQTLYYEETVSTTVNHLHPVSTLHTRTKTQEIISPPTSPLVKRIQISHCLFFSSSGGQVRRLEVKNTNYRLCRLIGLRPEIRVIIPSLCCRKFEISVTSTWCSTISFVFVCVLDRCRNKGEVQKKTEKKRQ